MTRSKIPPGATPGRFAAACLTGLLLLLAGATQAVFAATTEAPGERPRIAAPATAADSPGERPRSAAKPAPAGAPAATAAGDPEVKESAETTAPPAAALPPLAAEPPATLRSYSFLDLDIRQALSALAQEQQVNVILSPEVSGKITIHLTHVTIGEALRSIALAGGFACRQEGGSYYVHRSPRVADPDAGRLQLRVFRLNFAPIDKIQEILTAIKGIRMVRIHEPSRTVVVEDTPENIAKVERILAHWDTAPRQVLIEARILQVDLKDDMAFGIDWKSVFGDLTIGTAGFTSGIASLPAKGLGIVAKAGSLDQFGAAVNALQTRTRVNTLATPKILALHGKASRVQVGGRQGYRTNTFTPTGTTENFSFLDTGTILDITPYVDDGGGILMEVRPQINSVSFDQAGNPNQKTTQVVTSMMAKDGQTIFIGGLIEDTKNAERQSLPCIGDIPGLGLLFGKSTDTVSKSELIILITPRIVDLESPGSEGQARTRQAAEKMAREPLPLRERLLESQR